MTESTQTGFFWFRSDNRKSVIQNRKWLWLSIIAFTLVVVGSVAEAQQAMRVPRVGLLSVASLSSQAPRYEAFRRGLRELGYVEEKDITI